MACSLVFAVLVLRATVSVTDFFVPVHVQDLGLVLAENSVEGLLADADLGGGGHHSSAGAFRTRHGLLARQG